MKRASSPLRNSIPQVTGVVSDDALVVDPADSVLRRRCDPRRRAGNALVVASSRSASSSWTLHDFALPSRTSPGRIFETSTMSSCMHEVGELVEGTLCDERPPAPGQIRFGDFGSAPGIRGVSLRVFDSRPHTWGHRARRRWLGTRVLESVARGTSIPVRHPSQEEERMSQVRSTKQLFKHELQDMYYARSRSRRRFRSSRRKPRTPS